MNDLEAISRIMIAVRNPETALKLLDSLAVNNPKTMIEVAGMAGILPAAFVIPERLSFPTRTIPMSLYNEVKTIANSGRLVEAIKTIRAATGSGLKEAKDFVEDQFPYARSSGYYRG